MLNSRGQLKWAQRVNILVQYIIPYCGNISGQTNLLWTKMLNPDWNSWVIRFLVVLSVQTETVRETRAHKTSEERTVMHHANTNTQSSPDLSTESCLTSDSRRQLKRVKTTYYYSILWHHQWAKYFSVDQRLHPELNRCSDCQLFTQLLAICSPQEFCKSMCVTMSGQNQTFLKY